MAEIELNDDIQSNRTGIRKREGVKM